MIKKILTSREVVQLVLASKKNSLGLVGLLLIQTRVNKSEETTLCGGLPLCRSGIESHRDSNLFYNMFLPFLKNRSLNMSEYNKGNAHISWDTIGEQYLF